jgi:hypothetical protein
MRPANAPALRAPGSAGHRDRVTLGSREGDETLYQQTARTSARPTLVLSVTAGLTRRA